MENIPVKKQFGVKKHIHFTNNYALKLTQNKDISGKLGEM